MNNRTILLVEDNPDDVALTLRSLKNNNILNEMLDLKLPRISGLEVLQRLRADKRTKLLPVVVLTSSKEENDLIDCYKLGANSYIHKVDIKSL